MGEKAEKGMFTASEAKNRFGEVLDSARIRPTKIQKNGRAIAVVISAEEFERFEALEDTLLVLRAKEALADGFSTVEESEELLAKWLDAED